MRHLVGLIFDKSRWLVCYSGWLDFHMKCAWQRDRMMLKLLGLQLRKFCMDGDEALS